MRLQNTFFEKLVKNLVLAWGLLSSLHMAGQPGIAKYVWDIEEQIRDYHQIGDTLYFYAGDHFVYDLNSKEVHLYRDDGKPSNSYFIQNKLFYTIADTSFRYYDFENHKRFIIRDFLGSDVPSIYEGIVAGNFFYFTNRSSMYKVNLENLDFSNVNEEINSFGLARFLGAGNNLIYLNFNGLGYLDIETDEFIKVFDLSRSTYTFDNLLIENDLIFKRSGQIHVFIEETESIIELPIERQNTYVSYPDYDIYKLGNSHAVFYEDVNREIWTYNHDTREVRYTVPIDQTGQDIVTSTVLATDDNKFYFKGFYGGHDRIYSLDKHTSELSIEFDGLAGYPTSAMALGDSLFIAFSTRKLIVYNRYSNIETTIPGEFYSEYGYSIMKNRIYYTINAGTGSSSDRRPALMSYDLSSGYIEEIAVRKVEDYFFLGNIKTFNDIILLFVENPNNSDNPAYLHTIDDSYYDSTYMASACGTFLFQNDEYKKTGRYRKKIDGNGIDTVVNLNLTVDHFQTGVTSKYDFSRNVWFFESNEPSADLYQWIDCSTGEPIIGAYAQNFYPNDFNSYQLAISKGVCSDTTECRVILSTQENKKDQVKILPNPVSSDQVKIQLNQYHSEYRVMIYNLSGSFISEYRFQNSNESVITAPAQQGVYLLVISLSNGSVINQTLIKK